MAKKKKKKEEEEEELDQVFFGCCDDAVIILSNSLCLIFDFMGILYVLIILCLWFNRIRTSNVSVISYFEKH